MQEQLKQLFSLFPPFMRKYFIEIGLIITAGALAIVALLMAYFSSNTQPSAKIAIKESTPVKSLLIVDIEGAIRRPGVYKLPDGSRLNDLLDKAQNLSETADKKYFQKNFNKAEILRDQQKFYIPSIEETLMGDISFQTITATNNINSSGDFPQTSTFIGVNSASESELDSLSGIGPVTAQKIIDNRPYSSLEELIDRKILKSNVYNQIKDKLTLD